MHHVLLQLVRLVRVVPLAPLAGRLGSRLVPQVLLSGRIILGCLAVQLLAILPQVGKQALQEQTPGKICCALLAASRHAGILAW